MFHRFSDQARKAMALANFESASLKHQYIGTEHLLLGLINAGGAGLNLLKHLGVDPAKVKADVEWCVQAGPQATSAGTLPMTPRARVVVESAIREAKQLQSPTIGTEHLLLGLIEEGEGIAALVLRDLNVTNIAVRKAMLTLPPDQRDQVTPEEIPVAESTQDRSMMNRLEMRWGVIAGGLAAAVLGFSWARAEAGYAGDSRIMGMLLGVFGLVCIVGAVLKPEKAPPPPPLPPPRRDSEWPGE